MAEGRGEVDERILRDAELREHRERVMPDAGTHSRRCATVAAETSDVNRLLARLRVRSDSRLPTSPGHSSQRLPARSRSVSDGSVAASKRSAALVRPFERSTRRRRRGSPGWRVPARSRARCRRRARAAPRASSAGGSARSRWRSSLSTVSTGRRRRHGGKRASGWRSGQARGATAERRRLLHRNRVEHIVVQPEFKSGSAGGRTNGSDAPSVLDDRSRPATLTLPAPALRVARMRAS